MRALLLEDDYAFNTLIAEELIRLGFSVDSCFEGECAINAVYTQQHDLYIIDINVPSFNGFEVLTYIRERYANTPALIITTHSEIEYLKKGFALGCHDYLKKPFEMEELMIRIHNALRLSNPQQRDDRLALSQGYTYSLITGELYYHDILVELTRIESLLLRVLIQNIGNVVGSDTIQNYVWNNEEISPSTMRYWVHRLMKKLKSGMIVNVRGVGYRLRKL
ncbi:two component transcriptional regulator, winged helix family [Sulfuricurvum kujiense DSM 16994]|uniref:Two component transcriptional regulator, winged helix family n=1 Tax=Sulfuricurvum kujiense (strain ATCC BAA-921 / DSM 16994 / JCM 11577 / YK-1) TaxID=709032 RepID=E4U1A5_SULKY|nr:response regulator transcription factor [Sulfuricurvum kujiense]ADR34442.1 two component transcriptional regulator, winged helix family [Sulfuricurvum kujiense DSM 16994]